MNDIGVWVSVKDESPTELFKSYYCKVYIELLKTTLHRTVLITLDGKWVDTEVTHWLKFLPSHVPISVERLEALEKCVEALEDIANPMKKIQSDAEKQGATVNGMMAIQLCKDGNWLSSKAQEALTNLNKQ